MLINHELAEPKPEMDIVNHTRCCNKFAVDKRLVKHEPSYSPVDSHIDWELQPNICPLRYIACNLAEVLAEIAQGDASLLDHVTHHTWSQKTPKDLARYFPSLRYAMLSN